MKFKVKVGTRYAGSDVDCEVEVDKEYWESMSEEEQENYMMEIMLDMIEWDFEELEG